MKTVKQFIEELQKLDQDKPIWVYYDMCDALEPTISVVDELDYDEKMNKGDYIIEAW